MTDDDETSTALGQHHPETEKLDTSDRTPLADPALAWSVDDTDEVVPFAQRRSLLHRIGPAVALAVALVAVGVTAAILLSRDKPTPSAQHPSPAATPPPTPPRGPIDGTYRVDRYRGDSTVRMPGGRISSPDPGYGTVETEWWAFQSVCRPAGCTAVGTRVDSTTHTRIAAELVQGLPESERTQGLVLTGGQWKSDPLNRIQQPCGSGAAGEDTWRWSMELTQLPDGTLKGQESDVVETNECGGAGNLITTPVVATRIGELPPGLPPLKVK